MTGNLDGPAATRDQSTASTGQDTAWLGAYAISLAFTETSQAACTTHLSQCVDGLAGAAVVHAHAGDG